MRVYSKNRSPEYVDAVDKAFVNHQRRMYSTEQQLTPARAKEERVVDRAQGALRDAAAIARAERRAFFCSVVFEDIHGNFRFKRAPRVSLCG